MVSRLVPSMLLLTTDNRLLATVSGRRDSLAVWPGDAIIWRDVTMALQTILALRAGPVASCRGGGARGGDCAHSGWLGAAKADLDVFGGRLKADAKATFFNGDNLAALAWAGLGSAAMNSGSADEEVADYFDRHDTFGGFSDEALFVSARR